MDPLEPTAQIVEPEPAPTSEPGPIAAPAPSANEPAELTMEERVRMQQMDEEAQALGFKDASQMSVAQELGLER